jgi:protein-tyrosine phosphatase
VNSEQYGLATLPLCNYATISPMNSSDRSLEWDGCRNVRDLGGLAVADGRRTRRRSLIRADLLGRLTPRGRQQLLAYGVRTIVDLRFPGEIAADPPPDFEDQGRAPLYVNPTVKQAGAETRTRLKQAQTRAELYIVILDELMENQAIILRAIAGAAPGGLVFHCHSGKDRTGITAALLLSLAGVDEEAIAADYALTQERLWPYYERRVGDYADMEDDPWLIPITEPQTMLDTVDHLQETYGGVEPYLLQAGVTAEEIEQLKSRLIDTVL